MLLKEESHSGDLRESLVNDLAQIESNQDSQQLATLILAFHSVHHQSVDDDATYFAPEDRNVVQLVHNICYKWNKHHQRAILVHEAFKKLL